MKENKTRVMTEEEVIKLWDGTLNFIPEQDDLAERVAACVTGSILEFGDRLNPNAESSLAFPGVVEALRRRQNPIIFGLISELGKPTVKKL